MYGICYCNDMLPYKLRFGHHLAFAYFKVSNHLQDGSIAVIAQIRNALALATHSFFQERHFLYVHTPIITTSDCEGAGEMFQVTTLISEAEMLEKDLIKNPPPLEADMEAAKQLVSERGLAVKQLKDAKASKADTGASVVELNKAKESLLKLDERSKLKPGIPQKDGKIDYTQDFFAPEQSHTSRHLAVFWMVEPEIAFADLQDDMNCAEAYVKYMCKWLLEKCLDDMEFMAKS
ncbi:hypothetical protein GOBAR_AA39236 [Gossypium barbadense]|uniref:WHEP-TRS domain-containing protein n=1 Tax=Gossypium barbadense TaxID=3634 RepID=A0A2P5VRK8_GOSBA|nr:hypothetical protein GOBAR_AA39236 [Gossypium barbadense]